MSGKMTSRNAAEKDEKELEGHVEDYISSSSSDSETGSSIISSSSSSLSTKGDATLGSKQHRAAVEELLAEEEEESSQFTFAGNTKQKKVSEFDRALTHVHESGGVAVQADSFHLKNDADNNNNDDNDDNNKKEKPAEDEGALNLGLPNALENIRQQFMESPLTNLFEGSDTKQEEKEDTKITPITTTEMMNKLSFYSEKEDHKNKKKSSTNIHNDSMAKPRSITLSQRSLNTAPKTLNIENLRRSFQQSISATVLVSLAHKRYERRRLAAMEIEKIIRNLVTKSNDLERVHAILFLLSDDYVRSTSEDARKGGVVALAACAIGLKKAFSSSRAIFQQQREVLNECKDLILASVIHACQDHSCRVRYYATESLFNVIKVLPSLAVQHFFILFEILRSLYADVDVDVRSGAELLDKKLKEIIIGAINAGSFTATDCVPLFGRFFLQQNNKPTKRLTLTWLQEFSERLIGAPILEFLHLFLTGIFEMVADPNSSIRQLSLQFLNTILPKLLIQNQDFEQPRKTGNGTDIDDDMTNSTIASSKIINQNSTKKKKLNQSDDDDDPRSDDEDDRNQNTNRVDFNKILQSLVISIEHPDPFVRKVAMYWMSRIIQAHMVDPSSQMAGDERNKTLSAASISVRNALPHVLPGILLSIGDFYSSSTSSNNRIKKDSSSLFLPDQTTHSLAKQTNSCLQNALVGKDFVPHLDGFIVALLEELESPRASRHPPAAERKPYRMDVKPDGTGIESIGWFRIAANNNLELTKNKDKTNIQKDVHGSQQEDDQEKANVLSRLCALDWIALLYENVVPDSLKPEYAQEFIAPVIHQLVEDPQEVIIFKSLKVLAKITIPVDGANPISCSSMSKYPYYPLDWKLGSLESKEEEELVLESQHPMTDENSTFALGILNTHERSTLSRSREVFAAIIHLHSIHPRLLLDLPRAMRFMCTLQPPEFVFISFALELNRFADVRRMLKNRGRVHPEGKNKMNQSSKKTSSNFLAEDLDFCSKFVQVMINVLLISEETASLRSVLKDCISQKGTGESDDRRAQVFHILLHTFSHNIVAALCLCIWAGAYLTASTFLHRIDPLDLQLMFYLEIDQLVEFLERPLFRDLHLRMLECDEDPGIEGSGAMLYRTLKSILMILPSQSSTYHILKERLVSISRFRQSAVSLVNMSQHPIESTTEVFVNRLLEVRSIHCQTKWDIIRLESLEVPEEERIEDVDENESRRNWLGYESEKEEVAFKQKKRLEKEQIRSGHHKFDNSDPKNKSYKEFDSVMQDNQKDDKLSKDTIDEAQSSNVSTEELESKIEEEKNNGAWKEYWTSAGNDS